MVCTRFATAEFAIHVEGLICVETCGKVQVLEGKKGYGSMHKMALEPGQMITISTIGTPVSYDSMDAEILQLIEGRTLIATA